MTAPTRVLTNLANAQSFDFPSNWVPRFIESYRLRMQAWVDATVAGRTVGVSAWDDYVTTAIAEQIVDFMASGGRITLAFATTRPALYA